MATIPRYQNMGVQYADLPRLSTAGMEQTAKLYDVLSEKLDRMSAYYQERAVTEAQRAGAKYAVQNPITREQLDTALGTPEGVKVEGAGRIFQQTYEKVQAKQLGSELQLEGQRNIGILTERVKAGEELPMEVVQEEIRSMVDGYSALLVRLDPEEALRVKASLTATGNKLFQDAAAKAYEKQQAVREALYSSALSDTRPILESIIGSSGAIDPSTGKPVDINLQIENLKRPFLDSVRTLGKKDYVDKFDKLVREAMVGAVTAKLTDRKQYPTLSDAIKSVNAGDLGNLTGIYERLDQDQKNKVRADVVSAFSAEYTANEQAKKAEKEEKENQWVTLQLEFYNPNTSVDRKREITNEGIALGKLDPTQAASWMKPPSDRAEKHPELVMTLRDEISRGFMQRTDQLLMFKDRLNDDEFNTLATSMLSTQGKMALDSIKLAVGVPDNPFIPVSAEKNARYIKVFNQYQRELGNRIIDKSTGVLRDQSHTEAANAAIEWFNSDKGTAEAIKLQDKNKEKIEDLFRQKGLTYNGELYELNPDSVKGLRGADLDNVKSWLNTYKRSIDGMKGKQ